MKWTPSEGFVPVCHSRHSFPPVKPCVWLMLPPRAFDAFFVNPWGGGDVIRYDTSLTCQFQEYEDMILRTAVCSLHKNTPSFKAPWLGDLLLHLQLWWTHRSAVESSCRVHQKDYKYSTEEHELVNIDHGAACPPSSQWCHHEWWSWSRVILWPQW